MFADYSAILSTFKNTITGNNNLKLGQDVRKLSPIAINRLINNITI